MKTFLKPALRGLLLSLWCALLSAAGILAYQSLFSPVRQTTLDAELEAQHQALMSALSESQQASEQQRRDALDALTQQLDELSVRVDEQAQHLQALLNTQQHHSTRLDKLDLDHQKVAELENKLARLNRVVSAPRSAPAQKAANAAPKKAPRSQANTSKKRHTKPHQPVSVNAPFVLYDVQSRSGIRLAIVGKANARTLSELSALRQGQSYRGWKIVSVFASSIEVQRQGQRTTLTMMEG